MQINCEDEVTILAQQPQQRSRFRFTVEPVVFLFAVSINLSGEVITNLFLYRTCEVTLSFNKSTCDSLGTDHGKQIEELVQPYVAVLKMYRSLIEACLPAIMSLFLGPWSDKHGRKSLLLWPSLGFTICFLTYGILSLFPQLNPTYFLFAGVPVALSGGSISIITAMYSYMSDISQEHERAFRIGVVDAAFYLGFLVGNICCSPLYKVAGEWGFAVSLFTSCLLCFLGFLYSVLLIPESVTQSSQENLTTNWISSGVFDVQFIKVMLKTYFEHRENNGRVILLLTTFSLALSVVTLQGEPAIAYLYTREKFNWDLMDYTNYASFTNLINIIGMLGGVYIFSKWLKLSEAIVALIAYATKISSGTIFAISPKSWYLYLASCVGIIGGIVGPFSRTILTKTVPKQDIGKIFSVLSTLEALIPLAAAPLYTTVYNKTLDVFPGAAFLISVSLFIVNFIFFLCIVIIQKLSSREVYTPLSDEA